MTRKSEQRIPLVRHLLYEQVAERLRERIRTDKLWGRHLPAERDLAKTFGVSQDTLRKGLRMLAEEGLILRRHGHGTRVLPKNAAKRSARTRKEVALVSHWGHLAPGYAKGIMTSLGAGAHKAGWRVSFLDPTGFPDSQALRAHLKEESPDGIVLLSVTDKLFVEELLQASHAPVVLVDHSFPDLPVTGVRDDSFDGARQMVEHILSLGHRRIAYLDRRDRSGNPWRYLGYAQAIEKAGVPLDPELVLHCSTSVEEGYRAAQTLLALSNPPTAIVAFDDFRAFGAWRAAEQLGLEVGRDIALAGMGGESLVPGLPVRLTTLRVDMPEIGRRAVGELAELMAGREPTGEDVLVPAELVVGRSSRAATRSVPCE